MCGWMDGWGDGCKSHFRIAYSNQKMSEVRNIFKNEYFSDDIFPLEIPSVQAKMLCCATNANVQEVGSGP